jgi:hypothetical protein
LKNKYYLAFKARDKLLRLMNEDAKEKGWVLATSNKKRGMVCESRYIDSVPYMRAWASLPADPLTCLRFSGNMD